MPPGAQPRKTSAADWLREVCRLLSMSDRLDSPLTAWAIRLISALEAANRNATELAGGLSPQQLNWRSREDTWSIGQCLDHLRATNGVYLPAIAASLTGRAPNPVQEITPGWFGRWFLRNYIQPSPDTKRAHAPKKIAPRSEIAPNVLELFVASNEAFRELIYRARDFDVNRIRFRNPFVSVLRFTVGTGLEIVSQHQRRHLLQAERITKDVGFPARA